MACSDYSVTGTLTSVVLNRRGGGGAAFFFFLFFVVSREGFLQCYVCHQVGGFICIVSTLSLAVLFGISLTGVYCSCVLQQIFEQVIT